jgi:hypothetical protein
MVPFVSGVRSRGCIVILQYIIAVGYCVWLSKLMIWSTSYQAFDPENCSEHIWTSLKTLLPNVVLDVTLDGPKQPPVGGDSDTAGHHP